MARVSVKHQGLPQLGPGVLCLGLDSGEYFLVIHVKNARTAGEKSEVTGVHLGTGTEVKISAGRGFEVLPAGAQITLVQSDE